jgi:hypothetical protein
MSWLALELVGKRLELLAEIVPSAKRVAVIADPGHPGSKTNSGSCNSPRSVLESR